MDDTHLSNGNSHIFSPGVLYPEQFLLDYFGISKRTLARWRAAGLRPRKPGTKRNFYFSDDVLAIFRLDPGEIPPYDDIEE